MKYHDRNSYGDLTSWFPPNAVEDVRRVHGVMVRLALVAQLDLLMCFCYHICVFVISCVFFICFVFLFVIVYCISISRCTIPVSVAKTLLRKRTSIRISVFGAPNQGLESNFCCWIAGQVLAQKECFFTDTGMTIQPKT